MQYARREVAAAVSVSVDIWLFRIVSGHYRLQHPVSIHSARVLLTGMSVQTHWTIITKSSKIYQLSVPCRLLWTVIPFIISSPYITSVVLWGCKIQGFNWQQLRSWLNCCPHPTVWTRSLSESWFLSPTLSLLHHVQTGILQTVWSLYFRLHTKSWLTFLTLLFWPMFWFGGRQLLPSSG